MSACIRDEYYRLLKEWLDALLACTVNDPVHPSVDGAILCPACTTVHGRCYEAVYPLMAAACTMIRRARGTEPPYSAPSA